MRILIAEDDDATAQILTRVLEKRGHVVVRVGDGESALQRLRERESFDAVITDWMMPRLDGIGFIRAARGEFPNLPPIVVVTAVASDDAREQVLEVGADDYLAKPVQPAELVQCLNSCVARYAQSAATLVSGPVDTSPAAANAVEVNSTPAAQSLSGVPLVVLVSGAGGPVALQKIFRKLTHGHQASFVVVQHGPHWMLQAFALKLQSVCSLRVGLAGPRSELSRGTIWVAPGGKHTVLSTDPSRLAASDLGEVNYVRPSGDVLIRSLLPRARSSTAVILTGLGCDGAAGARLLKLGGGNVLVQHPASAEVAAMPKAAAANCGESAVVQLADIPARLDTLIQSVKQQIDSNVWL
jgi:two-component system, chemotaxis family, protein-glutamate methylesterase/glutaminase